ncbi:hypothetical protein CEXT_382391 [Caerostris extrusa]|uniref:Uncharacterized protein n=1 Tax=Caerostris extrusa TaxID=172846 RepID=A0AAV4PII4_CAEEX|nr:hypothetical protein CEXT_382391 [Caerostris extrusa]
MKAIFFVIRDFLDQKALRPYSDDGPLEYFSNKRKKEVLTLVLVLGGDSDDRVLDVFVLVDLCFVEGLVEVRGLSFLSPIPMRMYLVTENRKVQLERKQYATFQSEFNPC